MLELDKKKAVVLVLLDLSAAFDTVDHTLLLSQLASIGVAGTALEWFRSYLSNRTQTVCLGDAKSTPSGMPYGVPRGSVLGPVLFILYTGPIGQIIRRHGLDFHFYADDTQLCVAEIKACMTYHRRMLNSDKTEALVITTPHSKNQHSVTEVVIGDCLITPTPSARNIGVV